MKFRKLLPHKDLDKTHQREFHYKEMQLFFSDEELLKMSKNRIIKRHKQLYYILDVNKFLKEYFTILDKSWVILSNNEDFVIPNMKKRKIKISNDISEDNKTNEKTKLFPKMIRKNYLDSEWAIELTPYKSIEYQATMSIKIVVGYKRKLEAQMFVNPASRNLKNFELFKTTIEKLDEDSWLIGDLIRDLFSIKQLSLFEREASLTLEDMLEKKRSNYNFR